MSSNLENILNLISFESSDFKLQKLSFQTCPRKIKMSTKYKNLKKRNKYTFDYDSESEQIERSRTTIRVNPFTEYLNEERKDKEWIVKTPIKKTQKNNFYLDSLITKKKKSNKTNKKLTDLTEIIRGNLFSRNEENPLVSNFQLNHSPQLNHLNFEETDVSDSQHVLQRNSQEEFHSFYMTPIKFP